MTVPSRCHSDSPPILHPGTGLCQTSPLPSKAVQPADEPQPCECPFPLLPHLPGLDDSSGLSASCLWATWRPSVLLWGPNSCLHPWAIGGTGQNPQGGCCRGHISRSWPGDLAGKTWVSWVDKKQGEEGFSLLRRHCPCIEEMKAQRGEDGSCPSMRSCNARLGQCCALSISCP